MKVLVDTSIWSLSLRRDSKQNQEYKAELSELIKEVRVQIIGPIRQEILSLAVGFFGLAYVVSHGVDLQDSEKIFIILSRH